MLRLGGRFLWTHNTLLEIPLAENLFFLLTGFLNKCSAVAEMGDVWLQ